MKSLKYYCLEGLDGCGKSTTFSLIVKHLFDNNIKFQTCNPTRASNQNSLLELLFKRFIFLQKSSIFRAILYAQRSNYASSQVQWFDNSIVLGDRSIVTSYVTRWKKWLGSSQISILIVNALETKIPCPTIIFYLDAPHDLLMDRLKKRGIFLDIDETPNRSKAMRKAYEEIMESSFRPNRIKTARFVRIKITPSRSADDIAAEIFSIIRNHIAT